MTTGASDRYADLDRADLAVLGREWLLHGHLQDRVAMGLAMEATDREGMQEIAIAEWMAASPIYSRRMQQAMRFPSGSVETILKNLQLDIGAPHQFMDFRLRLIDAEHGEFFLAHCGALMDVEPMGESYVRGMCHAIEDPTFDATAAAAHPLAQIRPIHRPPRVPADRLPHCHWRIDIAGDSTPATAHPLEDRVAESEIARLPIVTPQSADDGGWEDYCGPFDPGFELEDLSRSALLVVLDEFALQSHLLLRSYLTAIETTQSAERAADILPRLVRGWSGLTAQRLQDAFDLPATAEGLAGSIRLHPMFAPAAYLDVRVEATSPTLVRLAIGDCPALREKDGYSWAARLGDDGMVAALESVFQAFDPCVRLRRAVDGPGEKHAFDVTIDRNAPAADECPELGLAKLSTGASFRLTPRRPVRV